MAKYTPGHFVLKVRRSRTGRGLFTESKIPRGVCIIEYRGRPVSPDTDGPRGGKYLFWTSDTEMIDGNIPHNPAKYINHSCKPNCEPRGPKGKVFIFSTRTIKPGEELTYDYGAEYVMQHFAVSGCLCASCVPVQP